MQASEKRVNELQHEINSGKLMEMNLEKSRSFCEAQMKELDKKYNGNRMASVGISLNEKCKKMFF